jgi:beta-carotene hydroxylase
MIERLRPRRAADYRALAWLAMAITVASVSWTVPAARPALLPLGVYFSFTAGVIAHGHYHCPIFASRVLNQIVNLVTTLFFGFPTFVWVAGHNELHHRYSNGPGDPTATWHIARRHNLVTAIVCPLYAMLYEPIVVTFLVRSWRTNRRRFRSAAAQIAVYAGFVTVGLATDAAAFAWAFALPWAVGLFAIHYFNYVQHVHCDPASEYAHSRDWTGGVLNFLVFNQGYHTVHHRRPGAHWSDWPGMHARVRDQIPAELQADNLIVWLVRQYVLAPFAPRFGTRQVGTPPWATGTAASTLAVETSSGESL